MVNRVLTAFLLSGAALISTSAAALAGPPSSQTSTFNIKCQWAQVPGCTNTKAVITGVQARKAISGAPIIQQPFNIKLCLALGIGC